MVHDFMALAASIAFVAVCLDASPVHAQGNATQGSHGSLRGALQHSLVSKISKATPFEPTPYWWHNAVLPMRTLSPTCSGLDYDGLIDKVNKIASQGVRVLAINSMYDPGEGYDYGKLWCGLAGGNYMKPLGSVFSDGLNDGNPNSKTVKNFVDHVHQLGMAVVSWMNPSYIWTGSKYYKEPVPVSKKTAGDGTCSKLPEGQAGSGKCRWFKWAFTQDKNPKMQRPPIDNVPDVPGCGTQCALNDWVDDDGYNAYFSYWAGYPTINWEDEEWQAEYEQIVDYWLSPDKGNLDGFVFDYPNAYVPGGNVQNSGSLDESVNQKATNPVKNYEIRSGPQKIANAKVVIAESYDGDGNPERAQTYNIDVYIPDDSAGTFGMGNRALYVEESIRCAIPSITCDGGAVGGSRMYWVTDKQETFNTFDDVFSGYGGVDAANAQCARNGYCTSTWNRLVTTSEQFTDADSVGSLQAVAWLTAGTMPDVVGDLGSEEWWTYFDWKGQDMLKETYLKAQSPALRPLSLRLPACFANADESELCTGSSKDGTMYSMVRYDGLSFGTGRFAVVNLCLSGTGCKGELDIDRTFKVWGGDRFAGTSHLSKTIELPKFGHLIEDSEALKGPRWSAAQAKNCYENHGSSYNADDSMPPPPMNLGSCFLYCAGDMKCNAVTVKWMEYGKVECHRKNVDVKTPLAGCDDSSKDDWATFYFGM